MQITTSMIKRATNDWSKIAGEPVKVQQIGSMLYAFGSELATLRLFKKMPNKDQGFSQGENSFYFMVELEF